MDTATPRTAPRTRPEMEFAVPLKLGLGGLPTVKRMLSRLAGGALILAAIGLWLVPGAPWGPEMGLLKLGASTVFAFIGLLCLIQTRDTAEPEIQFDPVRRELRVLRRSETGLPETILRKGYDHLGRASFAGRDLELWDREGRMILALPLPDRSARAALRRQLGPICQ